ncbi:hypothetical protein M9H77_36151 [Catharanthus roseus]|uniref:Uncharacterized protein n=1 Tax=Catharanthus roseus TaxID=4058 RepID=A0ACB9ZSA5_CATRO|nr:hypothetical protein M9H77_36151 [Catharanthus roseus]
MMKMPYKALFRVFCRNWLSTMNETAVLKKRINIFTVIFRNILRQIGQKKASKGTRPLVMPKNTAPGMVLLSPTLSTQGHTSPDTSTRQQSSKKKQPSTKLASQSPSPPSANPQK